MPLGCSGYTGDRAVSLLRIGKTALAINYLIGLEMEAHNLEVGTETDIIL